MWLFVIFDLPVKTKLQRKRAADFRKKLVKKGFIMLQYSVYIRHHPSRENAEVYKNYVREIVPSKGCVNMLLVTDKQFGLMENFISGKKEPPPKNPEQLMLF
jgi:CRISPR-associated protein Cas2